MARYQLNEPHFLGNRYFVAGSIIDWEGAPSRSMIPVEEVAEQRKKRYDAGRPHGRHSRDPELADLIHGSGKMPGMPRVAGPPGAESVSADPGQALATTEIAAAQREFIKQDAKARDDALKAPEKKDTKASAKADPTKPADEARLVKAPATADDSQQASK